MSVDDRVGTGSGMAGRVRPDVAVPVVWGAAGDRSTGAQGADRGLAATFGEHPAAIQRRDRLHADPVQPPDHTLTGRQHRHQFGIAARLRHREQCVGRLHQQTLRGGGRALGHTGILASTTDNSGPLSARASRLLVRAAGIGVKTAPTAESR
ncbi:hypothetical protein [Pseudonocardia charpentierae]|uniref:Uncharacterized protein n=1 Tax=Pseudonocardia charpentierae TaxID=3075545 RepID=A0ABU2N5N2_9PSEU|nr:hypothetical protein [Pseudonocardia sp. DSM 45834]MDT0349215.1 hypothetical protein [Pseudonocardia sp. DSM 45834]